METNNVAKKNENKKLIIICSAIVLVAVLVLGGILIVKNQKSQSEMDSYDVTYEDFTYGMKEDLPSETKEQVKALYDKYVEASKNNDEDAMLKVFEELDKLDIYDGEIMDGVTFTDGDMEYLDPDGDGVYEYSVDE